MNLESLIKTYLVEWHNRRAFRGALSAFEFLTGFHRDGGSTPGSIPVLIKALKERHREARLELPAEYELMCALTNLLIEGGVKPTCHPSVIYVSHITSWIRVLTDNVKHIKNAYSPDEITRSCVEAFDPEVNRFFDQLRPPVPVDPVGHTHRVFVTENQKLEQVGDGDRKFCHR